MRKMLISVLGFALIAAFPALLNAAEAERSYEQLSPDGKYVFVMLAKGPDETGMVDTLIKRYHHSGLYKVGSPGTPLWRVNWYSSRVHISSDGMHLVRIGRLRVSATNGKPNMEQFALAFYKNGSAIKKYLIKDLLENPGSLVVSGAGFQWQKRIAFDDSSDKLEVTLVTGQKKVFDIRSGSIIATKAASHKSTRR